MRHIGQMKAVTALTRYRHFGQAADSIGMTQSALSQSIKQLEEHYGVLLFERRRGDVRLTAFGEVVEEAARAALELIERAGREVAQMRSLEAGSVSIGVDPFLASSVLAPVLSEMLLNYPNLKFTVRSGDHAALKRRLLNNELDLYFGLDPGGEHPDIEQTFFEISNALVLCQPNHDLLTRSNITIRDILEYSIVSLPLPVWFMDWARNQITELSDGAAIRDELILEADNIGVIKTIVMNSDALMGAFPGDVEGELRRGGLKQISVVNWPERISGIVGQRQRKSLTPAAEALKHVFLERVQDLAAGPAEFRTSPKRGLT